MFCGPRHPRWEHGGHPGAFGGGGLGLGGGGRAVEPEGTRDPALLARGPLGGPEGQISGQRTHPLQGRPRTCLLQPPALGPPGGCWTLAPGWRDTGWTICGLQGRCRGFCWKRRKEAEEKQRAPWAGTWKELTQPHVATEPTSLWDSTGPHDGLKAPALRGTEGAL